MDLDELKDKLCHGAFSSLRITWNDDNGPTYQSVAELLADGDEYYKDETFISPEEKQRCITKNSIWTAHWYPNTPVGFCRVHAHSFASLMTYLASEPA